MSTFTQKASLPNKKALTIEMLRAHARRECHVQPGEMTKELRDHFLWVAAEMLEETVPDITLKRLAQIKKDRS